MKSVVVPAQTCRTPLATMGTDSDVFADTLAMKSTRLVSYHTLHHNIELDPNDARHPQSDNFFANWI